jgi:DNA-binding HxlR family transcriptional regulator/ubiquinone/menaquinone biosynthesis C-methylase UbiE
MPSSATALELLDLIQSHRVTAVIYVAAKLGIAELLCDGPKSLNELAEATGADQHALGRLLTALSAVGVCSRFSADRYSLTEMGASLDGHAEKSFKGWAILEGEMLSKSWSGMLESIMTGKTAAQLLGVGNSFDLMARTPANVGIFNAAMADLTRFVTPAILSAYDFGRINQLMDVGGGSGELIGAVARKYPHIHGIVFDLPRCAETANHHLQQVGVSERASFTAGDFFEAIPKLADTIILKSVIHDWNDERSSVILQNCRRALPENGTLLLVERIMPELPGTSDEDRSHAMSDLNMLRGPGGLERTEKEYRQLLRESDFHPTAVYPAGRFSLIEARVP